MRDSFSMVRNVAVQSEQKTPRSHCLVKNCAINIRRGLRNELQRRNYHVVPPPFAKAELVQPPS